MLEILKASVYCGTYAKYNAGSLSGGWVKLAACKNREAFLEACKKLHKDETEPEYMYQDKEHLPDEYYSESCIYPEVFDVIQAIKTMNDEKQKAFGVYCEENAAIPDMFDIEQFEEVYKPGATAASSPGNDKNALEELGQISGWDNVAAAIKIKDKHFSWFEKPKLEKSFCWGYGCQGITEEEANKACENFDENGFRQWNLNNFDKLYNYRVETLNYNKDVTLEVHNKQGWVECCIKHRFDTPDPARDIILTGEDADRFREEYKATVASLRTDFEKKIDAYLKRYGLTKIRKWTYWADE